MRVTIKEVAKLAGVSPSTVTRVVQNKSTISDETKKRVRAAMKELDYHPNLNARSLVSQSTQVIGLVLPDDSDLFCGGFRASHLNMTMPFRLAPDRTKSVV